MTFIIKVLLLCFPILLTSGFATTNVVISVNILLLNDLPTPYQRAVIQISPAALLHPAILIFIRRNDLMPYRLPNLLISLE